VEKADRRERWGQRAKRARRAPPVLRGSGAKPERLGRREQRAHWAKKAKRGRRDRKALAARRAPLVPLGRQA